MQKKLDNSQKNNSLPKRRKYEDVHVPEKKNPFEKKQAEIDEMQLLDGFLPMELISTTNKSGSSPIGGGLQGLMLISHKSPTNEEEEKYGEGQ